MSWNDFLSKLGIVKPQSYSSAYERDQAKRMKITGSEHDEYS